MRPRIASIGTGTLLVPMRAEGEDGLIGDSAVEIGPDHPDYEKWVAELSDEDRKQLQVAAYPFGIVHAAIGNGLEGYYEVDGPGGGSLIEARCCPSRWTGSRPHAGGVTRLDKLSATALSRSGRSIVALANR